MNKQILQVQSRLAGYEIFRIFACFGIVWFHLHVPGDSIAYAGLPYFMILTVYFLLLNNKPDTIKSIIKRIIIPWLFWTVVYALFIVAKSYILHESFENKFFLWMIATGTSLHLWYLPFSFAAVFLLLKIKSRIILKDNPVFWAALCLVVTVTSSYFQKNIHYTIPLSQYIFIIPSIFIGVFFFKSLRHPLKDFIFNKGFLFLFFSFILLIASGFMNNIIPNLVALCGFYIAGHIRIISGKNLLQISDATYGIYLVHPLTASILLFLGITKQSWMLLLLTFIISFLIVRIIKMTPLKIFV